MPKSLTQELAERVVALEKLVKNLSSGNRLDHASLDGTTLWLKNGDEVGRIGRQADGSVGAHVVRVQPPPQLTAAILTVGEQAGTCLVEWDGGTFDGRRMPLIHGHTEIWAERVGEDWSPTVAPGDGGKRVGTIRDRTGGEVVVALPQAGVWAVWLRAMGADRETAGPWSPVSTVEIVPLVDAEAIEQELEYARDRITEADNRLTAGQDALTGNLDTLRDRQETLEGDLVTGLAGVHDFAEQQAQAARDDAVNQAAADAQSEYDRLQELAERALSRAGDNVLEDPSFETDYWFDAFSWASRDTYPVSTARTGDQGLAFGPHSASHNFSFDTLDAEPDDAYRLSIWYRTEGNPDLDAGVGGTQLRIRDGFGGPVVARSQILQDVGNEWTRAVVTFQVPEDVTQLNAIIYVSHNQGTLIVDDVSFQEVGAAAEALRLAEVARQQAEAAHIAAGDAVDTAASAYDAAAGKSTVHWSLSAPSGTADNSDDVWWQYELRDGRRVVVGQWFWDDGVWRETEMAEEWLPLVNIGTGTYGDLHGDRLTANTVRTNHLLVGPQNLIADPGFDNFDEDTLAGGWGSYTGGWERFSFAESSYNWSVRDFFQIIHSETDDTSPKYLHYGGLSPSEASIPCVPGEQYKFRFQVLRWAGWSSDDDYRAQFRWADAEGNGISWTVSEFGHVGNQGWHTMEATAPEGAAYFYVRFAKYGAVGGSRGVGNVSLEKMADSSLIVRGAVKSHSVDTEEFFAAQAVIEKIWTEIVRSRLIESEGIITEDMIATGAITTPKLTVTDELVGEIARLIRIEAGSLASNDIEAMRIVSSLIEATTYLIHNADGDVSVRLDGMDNYLAGRLHAGMTETEGIILDWGEKVRYSGLTEEGDPAPDRTITTPYLNFHTDDVDYETGREPSIHLDRDDPSGRSGMMVINPGYPVGTGAFRGKLNVVGDVETNRTHTRESFSTNGGIHVRNSNGSDFDGGLFASGSNTRLLGRHAVADHSRTMISYWTSSQYVLAHGGQRRRSFTWGVPPPNGLRMPVVSVHMTPFSSNNNRHVDASTSSVSSTGYNINEYNFSQTGGSGNAGYYIHQVAVWTTL